MGTVLLATDLGPASNDAAKRAIELAAQLDAELLIVSVIAAATALADGGPIRPRVDQVRSLREPAARALVAQARAAGVPARFLIWHGEAGESIASAAAAEGCDLIVLGTPARTRIGRSSADNVSDYVIRTASCPVVVVGPTGAPRVTR
jgi:nucleotide-binding universal stress UspA family protein